LILILELHPNYIPVNESQITPQNYTPVNESPLLYFSRSILSRGGMQTDGTHSQVEHGSEKKLHPSE